MEEHCSLKTQRTLKDFKNQTIRTEPELKPDPNYEPDYVNFPIEWKEIEVDVHQRGIPGDLAIPGHYGDTDEEVVRTLFFHWYLENRKKHGWRWYNQRQSHA